jgi:hypothetical protein
MNETEGFKGLFRIGKGVPGAGDPHHRELWESGQQSFYIFGSLCGFHYFATDPRSAFVGTVKISVTIITLDIASRCHGEMDPSITMTGGLIKTGMPFPMHTYASSIVGVSYGVGFLFLLDEGIYH